MFPYNHLSSETSSQELSRIKVIIKSSPLLFKSTQTYISPSVANWAKIYALPTVHKPNL